MGGAPDGAAILGSITASPNSEINLRFEREATGKTQVSDGKRRRP